MVKSNIVDNFKSVSEVDQGVTFNASKFEEDIDSTILVRERTRGSKLEGKFKKKSGKIIKETTHTIIFLPRKRNKEVVYPKRDVVGKKPGKKSSTGSKQKRYEEEAGPSTRLGELEESSEDDTYIPTYASTTTTETETTENSESMEQYEEGGTEEVTPGAVETSTKETAVPQKMAVRQKMAAAQEVMENQEDAMLEQEKAEKQATNPGKKKKAVEASLSWAPPGRETRSRRLTAIRDRCHHERQG